MLPSRDQVIDDLLPLLALYAVKAVDSRSALAALSYLSIHKGREEVLPMLGSFVVTVGLIGVWTNGAGDPKDVGAGGVARG